MRLLIAITLLSSTLLFGLGQADLRFLLDKEQFQLLEKHRASVEGLLEGTQEELRLALEIAARMADPDLALRCHERLAFGYQSLEDALECMNLAGESQLDSLAVERLRARIVEEFTAPEDKLILDYYLYGTPESEFLEQIRQLRGYNPIIEELAKTRIDEISVQTNDSLAMAQISGFEQDFPLSKWAQVAYYYHLYHLSQSGDFAALRALIAERGNRSAAYQYISALYLMSPSYRRTLPYEASREILDLALDYLDEAVADTQRIEDVLLLYDLYNPAKWQNRVALMRVKAGYYKILAGLGNYGDDDEAIALLKWNSPPLRELLADLDRIQFPNNDSGDLAELAFWRGKLLSLSKARTSLLRAARSYTAALVYGAPRRKYDPSSLKALAALHSKLKIRTPLEDWPRQLASYTGILFAEHPFPDRRYTRIAIGDYDNDGYNDLLFNGNALYRNDGGGSFTLVSDSTNVSELKSNGALWADFNLDGRLDFVALSHDSNGSGEALMKNQDQERFVKVNERAGEIDDGYPTEGAAWVDIDSQGYPSLYTANYEKWQVRDGFPDFFWYNNQGYFSDQSEARGFRQPPYTHDPGQAGRGVAPADYDGDGRQEILVTNYRLDRNFCWDQNDSLFVDLAALNGLAGKYKQGYYGHSIGADWGDYDNDGDLDLFIANLAHPRYIDISDISQLLRNDGPAFHVVEGDTIRYWKFTDVTREAGITYDELHSDPLWLDADNDGWLDLFISSVYENDRSYLYRNNRDGSFTDITFLAGARVYNGWGNATADLNRDGLTDLVVGSGNGAKILFNRTKTRNRALFIKPVWKSGRVVLCEDPESFSEYPNSPAFGTRVEVVVESPDGTRRAMIRELSSAKGTSSQSSQELHFGLDRGKVESIGIVHHAQTPH